MRVRLPPGPLVNTIHSNHPQWTITRLIEIVVSNPLNKRMSKKNKNISLLLQISTASLQDVLNKSTSLSNTINNIGLDGIKTYYLDILRTRIENEKLDISLMEDNLINLNKNKMRIADTVLLDKNSKHHRSIVRNRIIRDNLIEYRCSECPIVDEYNGKHISLQLDHINGVRNDHRLENLRWLCPNCHSQQNTSFGKNKKNNIKNVKKIVLCACGNIMSKGSINCKKCASVLNQSKHRKFETTKEELEVLIKEKPMSEIGKMFGVSDNAVKKRCKSLGVELKPMRGYWAKQKALEKTKK